MIKVITYGTYDLLHYGHIRLLERAKALGDYLIVAVTADDFDKTRGKINVQQPLMERIEAVRATGLADEIIVEEYEGQKIDDIIKYDIDIFTVGSDWIGKFDYLNEYCKVVYLERTEGISSSEIRSKDREVRLGLVGSTSYLERFERESHFVNGVKVVGIYTDDEELLKGQLSGLELKAESFQKLLINVDAVYLFSSPHSHYWQIKEALTRKKHVLCESPIVLSTNEYEELYELAQRNGCILMEAIRTAYSTAFHRLLLLVKSGRIGDVLAVDATCTTIRKVEERNIHNLHGLWNSICEWGPTAMLPIFEILGTAFSNKVISSKLLNKEAMYDSFTKIDFYYNNAVASLKVGKGVKSEGELIISGTKGYVYVPAPWWKTDYFEIRYENPADNRRYFYQLDGEGIRYELVAFVRAIANGKLNSNISKEVSLGIVDVLSDYYSGTNVKCI